MYDSRHMELKNIKEGFVVCVWAPKMAQIEGGKKMANDKLEV